MSNVTWSYKEVTGNEATDALEAAHTFMNSGNHFACKTCAADMRGKIARAVVFYTEDKMAVSTEQPSPNTRWETYESKTGSDYTEMYHDVLNVFNGLSIEQQIYASIAFTNASNNDSCMMIYYPKDLV